MVPRGKRSYANIITLSNTKQDEKKLQSSGKKLSLKKDARSK